MKRREYLEFQKYYIMSLICAHSDNKVEEVHFNMALLSIGDRAPCVTRRKMSIKEIKEDNEDLRRIRSHVMNEVEEEKKEKYKQLEFEFDEDLVAPI
jgi:hypothetical protein